MSKISIQPGPTGPTIVFDAAKTERLRQKYNKAKLSSVDTFTFDGNTLVTAYAGYLLEYLDTKLGSTNNG